MSDPEQYEMDEQKEREQAWYGSAEGLRWQAEDFRRSRQWLKDVSYCFAHDEPAVNCAERHTSQKPSSETP